MHVDADTNVTSAYAAWNSARRSREGEGRHQSIADVLDTERATYKNVEYIVLVGGDDVVAVLRASTT